MSESAGLHHGRGLTHPPTVLLLGLLAQVALSFLPDWAPDFPGAVRAAGALSILAGVGLNVLATGGFARVATPVRPTSLPRVLVTDGVFSWTRNPMYVGMGAVLLGAAGALGSVWALVVVPVYVVWIDRLIRYEEAVLEAAFGESYRVYRRRVRRWL